MSKERDSQKRVAFPIQLFGEAPSFAELPDEIHVVPTGKWSHPVYGEMEITSAHVAEFVKNFKDKVRRDIPITAGHDNGMNGGELPAVGWFKELIDRGVNGLYAVVEWTEEGQRLLKARAFKYFSPEFYEEYSDPETGEKRSHVLVGGALTNKPYFKELDAVVAFSEPAIIHQFSHSMDLNTILAKKAEELTAEEKAFVKEHEAELSDEQKETFKSALEAPANEPEEQPEETPAPEGEPEPVTAREPKGKVVTMSEAEIAALRKAADEGAKALQKVEASERKELIRTKLVFSEANKDGRFLPKQEGALDNFIKTLSEKQRDQFVSLVANMPKMDSSLFSEIGDGGAAADGVDGIGKQVITEVRALIKASEGKLSYSEALAQLYTEKPQLKEQYEAALSQGAN